MADPIPPFKLSETKGSALTNLEFSDDLRQIRVAYNAFLASYTPIPAIIPTSGGGTGANLTLSGNRIIISSGAVMAENAAITANRAIISNASGLPTHSTTTSTELGFVAGVTGFIQDQIDTKFTTPSGTTAQYVRGDGSIANFPTGLPPGGPAGGDLTGNYPNPLIGSNKVTYAKFQQVSGQRLLGNPTGSGANASEISLGSGLSFSGSQLQVNGVLSQWTTLGNDIYYNTGNVGIGTPTPLARLDLDGIWRYNAGSVNHVGEFAAGEVKYLIQNEEPTGYASFYISDDAGGTGLTINQYGSTYSQAGQLDIPNTTSFTTKNINWAIPTPYEFKIWNGTPGSLVENFRIGQTYTESLNRVILNRGIALPWISNVGSLPYNVLITDSVIPVVASAGNVVLPDTTTLEDGHTIIIQSIAGATFTIVPFNAGTENIMGAASYSMMGNETIVLIKYPLNWRIAASYGSAGFVLASGSGTTAAGSAVNLGGTLTTAATISSNSQNITIAHSTSSRNTRFAAAGNFQIWNGATSGQTVFEYDPTGYVSLPSIKINPGGASFSAGAALHVRGAGILNNNAFIVQNSTPNTLFALSENGIATMGFRIDFNLAFGGGNLIQAVRALEFDTTLAPTSPYVYRFKQTIAYATLADWSHTLLEGNWALSSGANTATFLDIHPTLVQSGTHTGIIRGAYYRPVATLLGGADHRAWENTIGNMIVGSTSGSLGINLTAPTAKLHIAAPTGTGASTSPLKLTNSTTNILATPEVGAFEFGTVGGNNVLLFTRSGTTRESVLTGVLDTGITTTGIELNKVIKVRATDGNEYPIAIATLA